MDLMRRFAQTHGIKTPALPIALSPVNAESADGSEAKWAKGLALDENSQIHKTVDELPESDLERIRNMDIDIADVEGITLTKHAFFVHTVRH